MKPDREISQRGFYSTGQVALICSVTPDTVLKWVKAGRIASQRTAGGHYRIPRDAVNSLVNGRETPVRMPSHRRQFQYCWEYYTPGGKISPECRGCIVYRVRAGRCYELALREEFFPGHARKFCAQTCAECEYYHAVKGKPAGLLIISNQSDIVQLVAGMGANNRFKLTLACCEYDCSAIIDGFRPDYAVIDCRMGLVRSRELLSSLKSDRRVPFVKIILAGTPDCFPTECEKEVFANVEPPFTLRKLQELIEGPRVRLRLAQPG